MAEIGFLLFEECSRRMSMYIHPDNDVKDK